MFSVPMANPGGRSCRQHGGGGAVCRRLVPWRIGQEEIIGILVGNKSTKKEGKIPVLAPVKSTAVLFP